MRNNREKKILEEMIMKTVTSLLKSCTHQIFCLNPFLMVILWSLFNPSVSTAGSKRLEHLRSTSNRSKTLEKAHAFMVPATGRSEELRMSIWEAPGSYGSTCLLCSSWRFAVTGARARNQSQTFGYRALVPVVPGSWRK